MKHLSFVILLLSGLVGITFSQINLYEDAHGVFACYAQTTPWFEYNISLPDSAYAVECFNSNSQCEAIQFNFIPTNSQYAFFFKDYSDTNSTNIPDWMTQQNFKIYADVIMETEPKNGEIPFEIYIRWQGQNYWPMHGGDQLVLGDTATIYFYNFKSSKTNEWLPDPHTNDFDRIDTLLFYTQDTDYEKVISKCDQIRWHASKDSLIIDNMGNDSTATGIDQPNQKTPNSFILSQNYPNPFNPVTNIGFNLPKSSKVKLEIYDSNGRFIRKVINELLSFGQHTFKFNARNLSSGIYYYKIQAGDFTKARKMLILK